MNIGQLEDLFSAEDWEKIGKPKQVVFLQCNLEGSENDCFIISIAEYEAIQALGNYPKDMYNAYYMTFEEALKRKKRY